MPKRSKPDSGATIPTESPDPVVPVGPTDKTRVKDTRKAVKLGAEIHAALWRYIAKIEKSQTAEQIVSIALERYLTEVAPECLQPSPGRPIKR